MENFLYRMDLASKKVDTTPIDLHMAHSILRTSNHAKTGFIVERNSNKIAEVLLTDFRILRTFSLPNGHFYGHGVYHEGMNSILLTVSGTTPQELVEDTIVALDLKTWSIKRTFKTGTTGHGPHDIKLTTDNRHLLVILQGKSQLGTRKGGLIVMIDTKKNRSVKAWPTNDREGTPVHLSPWKDGDRIFFTMERKHPKEITGPRQSDSVTKGSNDYYKYLATEFVQDPSCVGSLSLNSESVEYLKPPVMDTSQRGPFNFFWSENPTLSKYLVVDFVFGSSLWIWDYKKKIPVGHRVFPGGKSSACMHPDGRSILAISDAGKGYRLEIPTLKILEEFNTSIPPSTHPLIFRSSS